MRRDLHALAQAGLIVRTYGGAQAVSASPPGPGKSDRYWILAQLASHLIQPGDAIGLDASGFAVALAAQIKLQELRDISVLTPSLAVAHELGGLPGVQLVVTGGTYRESLDSLTGLLAERAIETHRLQKAFLACQGFTISEGPTEADDQAATLKGRMIRNANQVILAVHSEDYGKHALVPICPLTAINWLICDVPLQSRDAETLQTLGIKLIAHPFG